MMEKKNFTTNKILSTTNCIQDGGIYDFIYVLIKRLYFKIFQQQESTKLLRGGGGLIFTHQFLISQPLPTSP